MHKILFLPHNVEVIVADGSNLIREAINAGIHINASCGGSGVCGKCRIIIKKGYVKNGISDKLSDIDLKNNIRIACKSIIVEDIVVHIPLESGDVSIGSKVFSSYRATAKINQIKLEDLKEYGYFKPSVVKFFLQIDKPSNKNRLPDVSRVIDSLKKSNNNKNIFVSFPVIRKIPDVIRTSNFDVTVTVLKPVSSDGKTEVINIQPGNTVNKNFGIAMDIGTTTVCGELVDLETGITLSEYSTINGQIVYGEDIISRIIYANNEDGLNELNKILIKTTNYVINKLLEYSDIDVENISVITLAGNTTMTQLFLKINPRYIRLSPYVPASSMYPPLKAVDVGLSLHEHAVLLVYPIVSSYVGGDIVSGVMSSGMHITDKLTLFIDVGTNAEIVIGNKDWLLCAACSAGPAFEGGGVEFGMRANDGAIEDFSIDLSTYEPMLITVGSKKPKGICGSGLITIVAVMFEIGMINNLGKFDIELPTSRIRIRNNTYEYVLAWADDSQIDRDIVISEIDIDNLIRTKGAIFGGCMSLLEEVGMTTGDIDQIILAGGFGSYVDLKKAITIGLLPEIDPSKVIYVGNSSLMGAKMSFLTNRIRKNISNVVKRMTSFELSETASYMDNYIASLFLPHTNLKLFPGSKK